MVSIRSLVHKSTSTSWTRCRYKTKCLKVVDTIKVRKDVSKKKKIIISFFPLSPSKKNLAIFFTWTYIDNNTVMDFSQAYCDVIEFNILIMDNFRIILLVYVLVGFTSALNWNTGVTLAFRFVRSLLSRASSICCCIFFVCLNVIKTISTCWRTPRTFIQWYISISNYWKISKK